MENFIDQLVDKVEKKGSCSVVGLDPQLDSIPDEIINPAFQKKGGLLESGARAITDFNRQVIDLVQPHVGVLKLQIAFYELLGIWGLKAYADTIAYAKKKELLVIGDIKRGDVSHTAEAYAVAHLGVAEFRGMRESAFAVDAVTLNPYLGSDSILPFIKMAKQYGKGLFVLVKTSNPSSIEIQDLSYEKSVVHQKVAELVAAWGKDMIGKRGYSSIGAVVAPTNLETVRSLRSLMPNAYFLVPGYGAQGGRAEDLINCFNEDGLGAIVNSSRGIINAYAREPWKEKFGMKHWQDAVEEAIVAMNKELKAVTKKVRERS
ncbi:MAG: orotidine-5'-phosphate decarboxylase [Candidatus Scalindua sp. AMX11]|nr:MAG: orotidine-5'-phosphate decarboxylase [Candidatus Scalindua sp.]NOG85833.1 orotidine-5'-phosphate decarboxylase [Planctomycetota bacterium]RZV96994.1 MAG: orotidine-5'-phosphate decarboxylase [Candidatus Scalindua sp. SCAELEC01]TDE66394.1 MAG: orotidine-5'-phosphate decarboxylase [Candidatus Scalindua sp. AMX11]GJQ58215.1 MAG: orotidine 5'-phosphate decarboxylase [Candidatus Scalindua sp.]